MAQSKVIRELANLGVSHANVDMNATQSKLKTNSPLHGWGENNLLPLQTIINNWSDETSGSAAERTSLSHPLTRIQMV